MDLTEALDLIYDAGGSLSLDDGKLRIDCPYVASFDEAVAAIKPFRKSLKLGLGFVPWSGQKFDNDLAALDTETLMAGKPGDPPPDLVLATAFDGEDGFFVMPDQVEDFLVANDHVKWILHNAKFDALVLDRYLKQAGSDYDFLHLADEGVDRLLDTMLLEALLQLALNGKGIEDLKGKLSLAYLAKQHLDLDLPKDERRTSFGDFAGKDLSEIPPGHLIYAAADARVTFDLWRALGSPLAQVRQNCSTAYGHNRDQLRAAWAKFGPLSLFLQIRTSIVFDEMTRRGLATHPDRVAAVIEKQTRRKAKAEAELAKAGVIAEGAGSNKSTQDYLLKAEARLLSSGEITAPLKRTPAGAIATSKEARADFPADPMLDALVEFKSAQKLLGAYASKLAVEGLIHPSWKLLRKSGRSSCGGEEEHDANDLAVQTLPKCRRLKKGEKAELTVRQCVAPLPGEKFAGADYSQLEVAAFAHVLANQLGFGDELADVVRQGKDVHRLIASIANNVPPEEVTPEQRQAAKAIVFGIPGTLTLEGMKKNSKVVYGVEQTDEQVATTAEAYFKLVPGARKHLEEPDNFFRQIAENLGITYGGFHSGTAELFKLLNGKSKLSDEDKDELFGYLKVIPERLGSNGPDTRKVLKLIEAKESPSPFLKRKVVELGKIGSYVSTTGRVRGKAGFGACRNGVFQSAAADGALTATWRLFRKGYAVAGFIHDEIIVSVPEDADNAVVVADISKVMTDTMSEHLGGLPVTVEPFVRTSLSARDDQDLEPPTPEPEEPSPLVMQVKAEAGEDEELPPPDAFWVDTLTTQQSQPAVESTPKEEPAGSLVFSLDPPKPRKKRSPSGYKRKVNTKALKAEDTNDDPDLDCPF